MMMGEAAASSDGDKDSACHTRPTIMRPEAPSDRKFAPITAPSHCDVISSGAIAELLTQVQRREPQDGTAGGFATSCMLQMACSPLRSRLRRAAAQSVAYALPIPILQSAALIYSITNRPSTLPPPSHTIGSLVQLPASGLPS